MIFRFTYGDYVVAMSMLLKLFSIRISFMNWRFCIIGREVATWGDRIVIIMSTNTVTYLILEVSVAAKKDRATIRLVPIE
ncbi:transmembrane protein, putative [Medicago truncatula]|uniref:Transmembrane protein, putative n=1 Tax=Medicago truncatula TaxID=3880 RepID=G7K403_MEDTR|nr:transmembrane protein, putative [Medicago truncatula]